MVFLGLSATAQEQAKKELTAEEIATKRVEHLKTELELNTAQVETIKAAMVSKLSQAKVLREQHKGDREAMKKAMEPIRNKFVNVLKRTLTDTQYAKWKEMDHGRKHHHRKHDACKGEPQEKKSGAEVPK